MTQPKSESDLERQKLFEAIRHFVSGKHQVPSYLSASDLLVALGLLVGEKV